MAVPRELDVELDHVRTQLLGATEGGQRVLGCRPARSAVGDHLGCHAACLGGVATCGQPTSVAVRVDTPSGPVDARAAWSATASGA